jgi:acyl-CoA synthetase (AMP-forming)/AMP-acid ligase II
MTLLYDWLKAATKGRGGQKALVYRDNYLSWRGLLHRVDRRAQEFKSMGLEKGSWVGLMLGNVPDFVILSLALSKLDATIVPIDPTTGARELELILTAAPLRALVTRPRGSEATGTVPTGPPTPASRARGRVEQDPTTEEVPEVRRRLQGTLLTCSVFKRDDPDFGVDPLAVMFTADSLGDPKGVLRTRGNVEAVVENAVSALDIDDASRILVAVPLFHAYGWDLGLLPALRTGATMFLEEEISPVRVGKILREQSIDVLPGTPAMYSDLSRLPTAKQLKAQKGKAHRFLSGGAPLDADVAGSFYDRYGVRLLSCYHTTEAGIVSLDAAGKSPATVGKPTEGIEVRVTTPKGGKLGASKKGVVWARGPSVSPRSIGPYRDVEGPAQPAPKKSAGKKKAASPKKDAATANHSAEAKLADVGEFDLEGWFRTGDVGKLDRYGRLTLLGREDHVVKVEGKRVALGEVEGCLEAFPKVRAARAKLITDAMSGAMVVAEVVAQGECEAEEILDHCARNLAPYKVPRRIELKERL